MHATEKGLSYNPIYNPGKSGRDEDCDNPPLAKPAPMDYCIGYVFNYTSMRCEHTVISSRRLDLNPNFSL